MSDAAWIAAGVGVTVACALAYLIGQINEEDAWLNAIPGPLPEWVLESSRDGIAPFLPFLFETWEAAGSPDPRCRDGAWCAEETIYAAMRAAGPEVRHQLNALFCDAEFNDDELTFLRRSLDIWPSDCLHRDKDENRKTPGDYWCRNCNRSLITAPGGVLVEADDECEWESDTRTEAGEDAGVLGPTPARTAAETAAEFTAWCGKQRRESRDAVDAICHAAVEVVG